MPRLPIPADTDGFTDETRDAIRHIIETRGHSALSEQTVLGREVNIRSFGGCEIPSAIATVRPRSSA